MALLSMTGFGKAAAQTELGAFSVEIRTVNNRYFDFNPRIPREWSALEIRLRDLIRQNISRGKVDLWVRWTPPPDMTVDVEIAEAMIADILRRFREAGERTGVDITIPWDELLKIPGILTLRPRALDTDALFLAMKQATTRALDELQAMRSAEGQAMAQALGDHLAAMRTVTDAIEAERQCVLERQRERLSRLVEQLRPEVGQALSSDRLEAEFLLFADRSDVTEEIVRLRSHFDAFAQLLESPRREPVGKRMEFIAQEILREANTIGSKARDTVIGSAVVALKHEIEKIREQLQNVE